MKRYGIAMLTALCLLVAAKVSADPIAADVAAVAKGNNEFGFELYAKLRKQPGNLFLSPFSISTALAMTYAGARGETAREMAGVLRFTLPENRLHAAYEKLLRGMAPGTDTTYDLSVANRLWFDERAKVLDSYLALTKKHYDAEPERLNFLNDPEKSRVRINEWVSEKTKKKIENLLPSGTITPATHAVLTNAIYFKDKWMTEFDSRATTAQSFWLDPKKSVQVRMMRKKARFDYAEMGDLQILEMPYRSRDLTMVVFLPRDKGGIVALEKQLTMGKVDGWISSLRSKEVNVSFPKFEMTKEFQLKKELLEMGMKRAFDPSADFFGMIEKKVGQAFWISDVIHKAYVKTDEEGTEAAAATAVLMLRNEGEARPPTEFRADHPFVFVIRDQRSGSILFLGRVSSPTPA
jgi:serpin B